MYHFEQALLYDKAPLTYYENAKKNAVASKITDTAASTLRENINTKYLETVFSVVYDETGDLAEELDSGETADSVIAQLQQFRNTLDSYDRAIDSFLGNSGKVQRTIAKSEKDLNATRARNKKSVAEAKKNIADAQQAVTAIKGAIDKRMTDLDGRLGKLEELLESLKGVNLVSQEDMQTVKDQAAEIITQLEDLKKLVPEGSSQAAMLNSIEEMITQLKSIQDAAGDLPDRVQEVLAAMDTVRTLEKTTLGPGFDAMLESMKTTIGMVGPFVNDVSGMLDNVTPMLDATSDTVDNMDKSLLQLQKVFRTAGDRIDSIIAEVEAAKEDERVELLIDLLGGDSDLYGKFFSSLVDVQTEEIYSVASYGAAMAPFYSVLAVWVGGVILVSILKTEADRKKFPGLSEAKYFFGKFLLFFVIGQLQAAVIVAGDIFLLDCQPVHPWLMWLSAAVTSLVFVLFIFALTLSFGDVGKAIVVVVMVVQIAGSSGSYPIEILPVIFSKIYRFFPFPYAINAMREALCGTYGYDYVRFLAELLVFGALGIVIGLIVRRPFIGLNKFVSEKIEETEVL
jgi:putative membrane protein